MAAIPEWITDRPLTSKDPIRVSRDAELTALEYSLVPPASVVFMWSPPKSGTTTFLLELSDRLLLRQERTMRLVATELAQDWEPSGALVDGITLLILDEVEDVRDPSEIRRILSAVAGVMRAPTRLIVTGDARVLKALQCTPMGTSITELVLAPLSSSVAAKALVVDPCAARGHTIDVESASLLCEAVGGIPYLIQRLARLLLEAQMRNNRIRTAKAELAPFLDGSSHALLGYFEDLVDRALNDDKAPYDILDLCAGRTGEFLSLDGLGITLPGKHEFASRLHARILPDLCSMVTLASRFGASGNYDKAIALYRDHLDRWTGTRLQRSDILSHAVGIAYAARNAADYTEFALLLNRNLEAPKREEWLREAFLPQVLGLLAEGSRDAPASFFATVVEAVDTISRTGRVRLYLVDAAENRLICRAVKGPSADFFKREPVVVGTRDWMVACVYADQQIADVPDALSDPSTNKSVASDTNVLSYWMFPLLGQSVGQPREQHTRPSIGVLCVDNPYHVQDRPSSELEQQLIADLMEGVSAVLDSRREEANRADLLITLELLTSLSQHLLTERDTSDILSSLLLVAGKIQVNLAMVAVRLVQGIEGQRMGIQDGGYTPAARLRPVFERPEFKTVPVADSIADPTAKEDHIYYRDVHDPKLQVSEVLRRFLSTVEDEHIPDFQLGSLLSFRMATRVGEEEEYLGMCNFYTALSNGFTDQEIAALHMIVRHAAVALYNARQLRWARRQRDGLKLLSSCIRDINEQTLQPDVNEAEATQHLVEKITGGLAEVFDVNAAVFCLVDEDPPGDWRVIHTYSDRPVPQQDSHFSTAHGVAGWAIETRKPQVISSLDVDLWRQHYLEWVPGMHTSAVIPMLARGAVTGVLALETERADAFTKDDIELIGAVVHEIPVARDNLKLVSGLQKANQQLENRRWTEAMGVSVAQAIHRVANIVGGIPIAATDCMDLLRNEPEPNDNILRNLKEIRDAANVMNGIAEELSNCQSVPLHFGYHSMADILADAIKSVTIPTNVRAAMSGDMDTVVYSDRPKLTEILACIIDNAAKATSYGLASRNQSNGVISVNVCHKEDLCSVSVTDQGNGVKRRLVEDVCHTIVDSQFNGHGIGLFVSSLFARRLGGRVFLAQTGATGARFQVNIPVRDHQPTLAITGMDAHD